MAYDIRTLLSPQNLLGLIQSIKGGVQDYLPPGLFANTRPCIGNRGTYRRTKNTRQLAPVSQYGGPPVYVNGSDVTEVPEVLLHSKLAKPFDANFYSNLQGLSDVTAQKYAEDLVAYETAELKRRITNLQMASKYCALTQGKIYVDSTNNFTLSSGSAQYTIDFKIPAANIDTIANLTGIAGAWSAAGTDIPAQLRAMKQKSAFDTGYQSMAVLYGISVPQWIRANTLVQNAVTGNYVLATEQYRSTEIPAKFSDYDWYPQYGAMFQDPNGVNTKLWPDNIAVFIPLPDPSWQEMLQGTTRIPTSIGSVGGDALQTLMSNTSDVAGMFSYATIDRHGVVEQVAGDTWLPVPKVPGAIYIATVG